MSFWKASPGPHWSDCIWSYLSCSGIPHAYPIRNQKLDKPRICPDIGEVFLAKESDVQQISEFLQLYFTITPKSKCILTSEELSQGMENGWIVCFTRCSQGILSGVIISRPLGNCIFQYKSAGVLRRTKCPKVGYIDFFCVREDMQKKGIGSELLCWMDYYASLCHRYIHFFQKELYPLYSLPPLWQGQYVAREIHCVGSNPNIKLVNSRKVPAQFENTFSISFLNEDSKNTEIFKYKCKSFNVYLAITNTFHKAATGGIIGEVLFYRVETIDSDYPSVKTIAASIEEILEYSNYKYILMDKSIPHQEIRGWKEDAPYFLYCYNLNPRHFFNVRPEFWF